MESEVRNVLPLSAHSIPELDFEAPIRGLPTKTCYYFGEPFGTAAMAAGDTPQGQLLDSLCTLCRFMPNYLDRGEPYRPILIAGDRRSAVPADLTPEDLVVVADLHTRAKEPALRARLGDILFLRKRDHRAALDAANNYVLAADALLTEPGWFHAKELYQRALQLALAMGQQKDTFKQAEAAILAAVDHPLAKTQPFYASHFLKVVIGMGLGDPGALSQTAKTHADLATAAKDFRRARQYRTLEADFLHMAKRPSDENAARLLAAETWAEEGEQALQRVEPSHMVAAHFLSRGIEALRQAKGDPSRIRLLRDRLLLYQAKSMDEMKPIEVEIDLSDMAEKSMEFVRKPDFEQAIERLALGFSITDIKKLREEVLEAAKQAPLTHMMGSDIVNQYGQVQKSTGALLGATGDAAEKEMESRMFQLAARSHWIVRANGFIIPGRVQVWRDHPISIPDFEYLVRDNPFIPPGHEGIFMRGLFYGLAGDTMLAAHLLVPQVENSIRYMLHSNGFDVSNLNPDMTQPVKLLGPLMDMPETKQLLGEDLHFEIRGLLIEKTGYSFRNDLSHGFITERESYSESAVNCWWLILRMCVTTHRVLPPDNSSGEPNLERG